MARTTTKTANVYTRVDPETKEQAEAILNHLLLGRQIGRGSNRRSRICCVLCIAHGLSLLLFFKQYEHKYMGNNREYYRIRTRFLHKK